MRVLISSKNVATYFFQVFFSELIVSNVTKVNIFKSQIVHHNKHITITLNDDILAHTAEDGHHLIVCFSHKNVAFFNYSGVTKSIT